MPCCAVRVCRCRLAGMRDSALLSCALKAKRASQKPSRIGVRMRASRTVPLTQKRRIAWHEWLPSLRATVISPGCSYADGAGEEGGWKLPTSRYRDRDWKPWKRYCTCPIQLVRCSSPASLPRPPRLSSWPSPSRQRCHFAPSSSSLRTVFLKRGRCCSLVGGRSSAISISDYEGCRRHEVDHARSDPTPWVRRASCIRWMYNKRFHISPLGQTLHSYPSASAHLHFMQLWVLSPSLGLKVPVA